MQTQETVFVGLSGGVDSSVAAARLLARGYNVVGVFIKVWQPEWLSCNWEAERLDAMRVAARLGIPFLTCDAEAAYKQGVADYFIAEYAAGRTPNPDVMCNKQVKFKAFLDFALERGADYIATGHYAQVKKGEQEYELWRGNDADKDQSYFLWTLTQHELSRVLLPVGDTKKALIRKEAERAGLITANKKDSQGICFLGHVDIVEFLSHYLTLTEGEVHNETGEVIGVHSGVFVYTIGQRHGFTITKKGTDDRGWYVVGKDLDRNVLIVSTIPPAAAPTSVIILRDVNLIATELSPGSKLTLQVRYRQTPKQAIVHTIGAGELSVQLLEPGDSISAGQSCVLYDGDRCLGGGTIEACQLP